MLYLYIRVLVICAYHLIANCVCEKVMLWLVLRREQSIQYDIVSSRVKKKDKKGTKRKLPEGTNSKCPLKVSQLAG